MYFWPMSRKALIVIFLIQSFVCIGQVSLEKLILSKNEKYFILDTDMLTVDSLIMGDSSQLILNPQKRVNHIHANVTIVGRGCVISGIGVSPNKATEGLAGADQLGPCLEGKNGGIGSHGSPGQPANNLFLYFTDLIINGSLIININGSDGGEGGNGGRGGGGGPGTRVCKGGNGGMGGHGGKGGNGGDGGSLSIQCKNCPALRGLIYRTIIIKNYGGYAGLGGEGGPGGLAGLGPLNDGVNGKKGLNGKDGIVGKVGTINFSSN